VALSVKNLKGSDCAVRIYDKSDYTKEDYAPTDEQLVRQMAVNAVQRNTSSISEVVGLCTGADIFKTFTEGSNRQRCGKCKCANVLNW